MQKTAVIILFILQLSFSGLFAQNDTIKDNSYYFDDGGISNSKNIFKINTLPVLNGDLPIYYERVLHESFTVEVGAGLLFPYHIPGLHDIFNEILIKNPDNGYSLSIHPKYYLQHEAPEFNYIGVQFRKRKFNLDSHDIVYTDITINYGLQLILGQRVAFDYSVGIGYRFKNDKSNGFRDRGVSLPLAIKLGVFL